MNIFPYGKVNTPFVAQVYRPLTTSHRPHTGYVYDKRKARGIRIELDVGGTRKKIVNTGPDWLMIITWSQPRYDSLPDPS